MNHNKMYNRQSIRLKGYDYSRPGFYFITICTQNSTHIFGDVVDAKMVLNEFGKIAWNEWFNTECIRDNVLLDAFVVMPNHIHGIIEIFDVYNQSVGVFRDTPLRDRTINDNAIYHAKFESPSNNLGAIVRGYKSAVTKRINQISQTPGTKIWQRNYYDHIIRNEQSLHQIREYIKYNPKNWKRDRFSICEQSRSNLQIETKTGDHFVPTLRDS